LDAAGTSPLDVAGQPSFVEGGAESGPAAGSGGRGPAASSAPGGRQAGPPPRTAAEPAAGRGVEAGPAGASLEGDADGEHAAFFVPMPPQPWQQQQPQGKP
jgi:hypothetical protein